MASCYRLLRGQYYNSWSHGNIYIYLYVNGTPLDSQKTISRLHGHHGFLKDKPSLELCARQGVVQQEVYSDGVADSEAGGCAL